MHEKLSIPVTICFILTANSKFLDQKIDYALTGYLCAPGPGEMPCGQKFPLGEKPKRQLSGPL